MHRSTATYSLAAALLVTAVPAPAENQRKFAPPRELEGQPHYFVDPGGQAHRQMLEQLPPGTVVATIPTSYRLNPRTGRVEADRQSFAFLYGNVEGDAEKEFVVGCYFPADASGARDD